MAAFFLEMYVVVVTWQSPPPSPNPHQHPTSSTLLLILPLPGHPAPRHSNQRPRTRSGAIEGRSPKIDRHGSAAYRLQRPAQPGRNFARSRPDAAVSCRTICITSLAVTVAAIFIGGSSGKGGRGDVDGEAINSSRDPHYSVIHFVSGLTGCVGRIRRFVRDLSRLTFFAWITPRN